MNQLIYALESELKKPLPGIEYQYKMAPNFRGEINFNLPYQRASVLILVFPANNSIFTLFIKRPEYDGAHSGQISFPGGKFEPDDITMKMTALRETKEEIGININKLKVLGQLTTLHIPVSNFEVFPFVGYALDKPDFIIDPVEVDYIIQADIMQLVDPKIKKTKKMLIHETEMEVPYYNIDKNHIWGATAMILSEFLEIVIRAEK